MKFAFFFFFHALKKKKEQKKNNNTFRLEVILMFEKEKVKINFLKNIFLFGTSARFWANMPLVFFSFFSFTFTFFFIGSYNHFDKQDKCFFYSNKGKKTRIKTSHTFLLCFLIQIKCRGIFSILNKCVIF